MKKDKEWLKEALVGIFDENDFSTETGFNVYIVEEVDDLVDQLEEPEQEKVVVPQWLGKWMDSEHITTIGLAGSFYRIGGGEFSSSLTHDQNCYIKAHAVDILRGIGLGYEVEKEKLYRVVFPFTGSSEKTLIQSIFTGNTWVDDVEGDFEFISEDHKVEFTEQEIKSIDERYWAFAEEITI